MEINMITDNEEKNEDEILSVALYKAWGYQVRELPESKQELVKELLKNEILMSEKTTGMIWVKDEIPELSEYCNYNPTKIYEVKPSADLL